MHTPFIEEDIAMLRRHYDVDVVIQSGVGAVFAVFRHALAADISITWFASVYSLFMVAAARMRGRPSVVLLGGVDTARDDCIGYGIWRSAWRRPLLRWTLRNASRIFAVDASLGKTIAISSGIDDLDIDELPTGYDAALWIPAQRKEATVLLVAGCRTRDRMLVKGVDVFVEAARHMSDIPFVVIGTDVVLLARETLPKNLTIIPAIERSMLLDHYQRAAVYCQPSRHEGLPNSLCEAMLCGCIPVGTSVGGVANAIGDCGFVVAPDDANALVGALRSALALSAQTIDRTEPGARARARIVERYPLGQRESQLVNAIEEMLHA